jgi:hypothetical protein
MKKILKEIYPFCKDARNEGTAFANGYMEYPARVKFLIDLLEKYSIPHFVDSFATDMHPDINFHNIVIPGTNPYMVIAHHDIVSPGSDNANDNSASVINAIYLKSISPDATVVLTDCEELGMYGAKRLAQQIKEGLFGNVKGVINLELSGLGGENIMVGDYPGALNDKIKDLFDAPVFRTPPNDAVIFRREGIDSTVINPLPVVSENVSGMPTQGGYFDNSSWFKCHTIYDSLDKISTDDMHNFVVKILVPLIKI